MSDTLAPLEGFIDSVDRTLVRGWAYDGFDAPVHLQVFADEAFLGDVVADKYRADLVVLGSAYHAFAFAIDGGLPAGLTVISVRRAADGAMLGNSPFDFECEASAGHDAAAGAAAADEPAAHGAAEVSTPVEGNIDSVDETAIHGWARDGSGRPVQLRVSANSRVLGLITADLPREDLQINGIGDGRCAFVFVFADPLPPGQVAISVVRDADDVAIGNSPFNVAFTPAAEIVPEIAPPAIVAPAHQPMPEPTPQPAPQPVPELVAAPVAVPAAPPAQSGELRGRIEVVGRDLVQGWAFDAPSSRVTLRIFANDVALGTVLADRQRDDLGAKGFGDGRHGFVFVVPGGLPPGRIAMTVRRAQDGAAIGNSPFFVDFD